MIKEDQRLFYKAQSQFFRELSELVNRTMNCLPATMHDKALRMMVKDCRCVCGFSHERYDCMEQNS